MPKRSKKTEEVAHTHSWEAWSDVSSLKCVCGSLLISQVERERREDEWNKYRAKVRETRAYSRFIEQKEAFAKGDIATIKELALEARKDLLEKTDWIDGPPFPDPSSWTLYVISDPDPETEAVEQVFLQGI